MKFSDYQREIEALQAKTANTLLDEEMLSESVEIDRVKYSIYLGDKIVYRVNDNEDEWGLKRAYSSSERGWPTLLGGLKTKVEMAMQVDSLVQEAIAEKYLKEEVLERLTGTGGADSDNATIIRKAANKRINKLNKMVPKYKYLNAAFEMPSPSSNYTLALKYIPNGNAYFEYGELPNNNAGIKCCWNFLQHYDELEATVKQFVELWKPVVKFVSKTNPE